MSYKMSVALRIMLVGVIIVICSLSAYADNAVYSLERLIDIALENNLGVRADKSAVEEMNAMLGQVHSSQEWRMDGLVNTDYEKTPEALKSMYSFADVKVDDAYSTVTGTLAISKPLFLSANSQALMSKTEQGKNSAEQILRQTELTVMVDVIAAFYNVFRAWDGVVLAEAAVQNSERSLEISKAELAAGKGIARDVDDAKLALAEIMTTLQFAKDSLFLAECNLSLAVGKPGLSVKNLICPVLSVDRLPYSGLPWSWSLEKMQEIAIERRPEYAQGKIGVDIANIELNEAKLATRPTISLDGSYLSGKNMIHTGFSIDSDYRFTGSRHNMACRIRARRFLLIPKALRAFFEALCTFLYPVSKASNL
jgi:outer membrane protein TolC